MIKIIKDFCWATFTGRYASVSIINRLRIGVTYARIRRWSTSKQNQIKRQDIVEDLREIKR